MKRILLLIIIGITFFPSCRSAKKIQTPIIIIKDTTVAEVKQDDTVVLEDTVALIRNSYNLLQSNPRNHYQRSRSHQRGAGEGTV